MNRTGGDLAVDHDVGFQVRDTVAGSSRAMLSTDGVDILVMLIAAAIGTVRHHQRPLSPRALPCTGEAVLSALRSRLDPAFNDVSSPAHPTRRKTNRFWKVATLTHAPQRRVAKPCQAAQFTSREKAGEWWCVFVMHDE